MLILTKSLSEGLLNTGAWLLNHAKARLYGKPHFWKLRSLVVKIGNMKICLQFWSFWRPYFPLMSVICGAWFVVSMYFIRKSVSIIYRHLYSCNTLCYVKGPWI
jgi:hypothetical protein